MIPDSNFTSNKYQLMASDILPAIIKSESASGFSRATEVAKQHVSRMTCPCCDILA